MNYFSKVLVISLFFPCTTFSQNSHEETTTYQYDNLNRLIQVDFSDGTSYNYIYDNLGNRIQISVTEPKDLYLENVSVSQMTTFPGSSINVSADFRYNGSQTTQQLPSFTLGYHISNTCNYGIQSILLDTDYANLGINNDIEFLSNTLTIPSNTSPGNYEILFYGDLYDDLPAEDDELNNIVCVPITILSDTASLQEEYTSGLIVFPNPTTGDITIQLPEALDQGVLNISVSDMNGKIVLLEKILPTNGEIQLEIHGLETGTYLLSVASKDQNWSELFVKK